MYELAEHLHQTFETVSAMSTPEYMGWRAYFDVRAHEARVQEASEGGKMVWIRAPWEARNNG